jgi:glutamate dehydrogenase
MSGDVFGNGMLLSPAIRLSPPSTTATSSSIPIPIRRSRLAERQRLFELPRSSWQDYDKSLISAGGGVFSRRLKSDPAVARGARRCWACRRPRRRRRR